MHTCRHQSFIQASEIMSATATAKSLSWRHESKHIPHLYLTFNLHLLRYLLADQSILVNMSSHHPWSKIPERQLSWSALSPYGVQRPLFKFFIDSSWRWHLPRSCQAKPLLASFTSLITYDLALLWLIPISMRWTIDDAKEARNNHRGWIGTITLS